MIFMPAAFITLVAFILVWFYAGLSGLLTAAVLVAIELTFSFDNAIVNAKTLSKMEPVWQRMFMTLGIVIAVFGMRILFPLLIVMATTSQSMAEVVKLALFDPSRYAAILNQAGPSIAAFGGLFLLTLALQFFFDEGRDIHWIARIERPLQHINRRGLYIAISSLVLFVIALLPLHYSKPTVILAGMVGVVVYLLISGGTNAMMAGASKLQTGKKAAFITGLSLFIYLEALDASFSFDGVIGAFAISHDVILIAVGLGAGAFWVRSLTLLLVHKKTLTTYRYLEHAAHYIIGLLALSLLVGLFIPLPEMIVGVIGIGIIAASVRSSVEANKKESLTN